MASFSFGAGNARKLAAIPLYAAGALLTLVVPRTRDRWVIGSAAGIADGALALWETARAHGEDPVWLVDGPAQDAAARARGIRTLPKSSVRALWATARARVVVVTHGFGDVNRYAVRGAFVVQLWHGIPLKRIGIDSPETVRSGILPSSRLVRRLLTVMYRGATRRISLIPAASHLVRGRLESAFSLRADRVPVTGEPRTDVLSRGTAEERRGRARAVVEDAVGELGDARLVLYAPTWRDGAPDPAVPDAAQWEAIVDTLKRTDAVLLVRSHPLGAGEYRPPRRTARVRGIPGSLVPDITPALPALDVLVTDYSSLAFDAALVPVPTVFLAPDAEPYARTRGFYGRYEDVAGPAWATDWSEAIAQIGATLTDPVVREGRVRRAEALSRRMHAFRDGRNTERVYGAIVAALRRRTTDPGGRP
ncbi:CDP-glycerol glycerophosphotransferase family protein [Microbacterium sp. GXF7504]